MNNSIDFIYKQNLEQNIIKYLAKARNIDIRTSMERYYKSELSEQIENSMFGIDTMDYKYLAEDLIENEPELFSDL